MPIFVNMNMNSKNTAAVLVFLIGLLVCGPGWAAANEKNVAQLMETADSLHSMGRSDSAIVVAREAARLADGSNDPRLVVTVNASLGVYLRSTGKIDEALKCYDRALDLVTTREFRNLTDEEALEDAATLYINLATLHLDMSHKEEAAKYARMSAEWTAKCSDRALQAQIYGAVGSVLTAAGLPEEALPHQTLSYTYALEAGDEDSALRAAAYAMLTCDRLGRRQEAGQWRGRCRELMAHGPATMTRLVYFQAECSISLRREQPRASIAWFDSILALDGIEQLPFVVFDCYNNMHVAYAELGRYDSAYATLLRGNALRDSLYEGKKVEDMRDLTVKYDTREKELALARSEAGRANMRFRLAVALAVLAVVVALFVLYVMRQRRLRHERELEFATLRRDAERQLTTRYVEGLENERTRMARELHDGVCNDLTAIRMRLGEENPSSPALGLLDTCRDQVRRISHELMPPEFTYATIDEVLRYYVRKLDKAQAACRCTYASQPEGADWQAVPDAPALEMYRIVQEAAGNAMKHSGAQNIRVCMTRTAAGIELAVSDDGLPRASQSSGIGTRTMRQRAAAAGGQLAVEHTPEGTTVRLTLKLKS